MTTQKRHVSTVLASALAGIAVVAAIALGVVAIQDGMGGLEDVGAVSGETRIVTDSVGREVEIPADPQSVVSMDAFSSTVAVLAGAGERMSGAPSGVSSNVMLQEICPDVADVQVYSGNSVNVETLLAEGTDVVLVRGSLYESDGEIKKLDVAGIPYVVVDYGTVDEQIEAIRLVGQVFGGDAEQNANDIADYYGRIVSLVEERAAQIPEEERVSVYHSVNDALLTDGAASLSADWMSLVGVDDVSAHETGDAQGDYDATLEQVYVWNPDVIVCSTASTAQSILDDAQWAGLAAVEEGNVYALPVSASRWGHRGDPETFLGMLWLAKTVYPSYYEDIDLKQTVTDYYRDVIGIEVDDELWEQILSGEGLRDEGSGGGAGTGGGAHNE